MKNIVVLSPLQHLNGRLQILVKITALKNGSGNLYFRMTMIFYIIVEFMGPRKMKYHPTIFERSDRYFNIYFLIIDDSNQSMLTPPS